MPRARRKALPAAKTPATAPRRTFDLAGALIALGLVMLVALIYAPVRHYGFVPLDDPNYVPSNPHVLGGLTWEGVRWAFTSRWASYWIPLTWLSYMAEIQIFGVDPGVLHITNVLLHAANTVILFGWLRRATGSIAPSALVAVLFAAHPLHVESVAWITERKDVLSTLFMLLAIVAYTRYLDSGTTPRYVVVCGLFVAGILAKPMVVTLPIVLLLCDVWPLGRLPLDIGTPANRSAWRSAALEKWPLAAIAVAGSVAVYITQQQGGAMLASDVFPPGLRIENAITSCVIYMRQMIWPVDLMVWYVYPDSMPAWQVAGAAALLAIISVIVVRLRRHPYLAVGWFWYLVTLAPMSGLVQVGLQSRADRFTYVPLIGLFIMIAWAAFAAVSRIRIQQVAFATVILALAAGSATVSMRQVTYWQDGVTMWGHAAELTPGAAGAQAQFEWARSLTGTGRTSEALPHFTEAIRAKPDWLGAHGQYGLALSELGRTAEAQREYEIALRLDPAVAQVQNDLGALLATNGHIPEALPHFAEAVRLEPAFESARVNLAVALVRVGRREDALREVRAALLLNPNNAQALRLLNLLTKGGTR